MSVNQVLTEIEKLSLAEQRELLVALSRCINERTAQETKHKANGSQPQNNGEQTESTISEDDFLQILLAEGIISSIPDPSLYTDEDDDFEPLEIEGEPLSEMIIRERR